MEEADTKDCRWTPAQFSHLSEHDSSGDFSWEPILKETPCHASSVSSSQENMGWSGAKSREPQSPRLSQIVSDTSSFTRSSQSSVQAGARHVNPAVWSAHKAGDSSVAGTSQGSEGKSPSALPRVVLLSLLLSEEVKHCKQQDPHRESSNWRDQTLESLRWWEVTVLCYILFSLGKAWLSDKA